MLPRKHLLVQSLLHRLRCQYILSRRLPRHLRWQHLLQGRLVRHLNWYRCQYILRRRPLRQLRRPRRSNSELAVATPPMGSTPLTIPLRTAPSTPRMGGFRKGSIRRLFRFVCRRGIARRQHQREFQYRSWHCSVVAQHREPCRQEHGRWNQRAPL